MKTHESWLFEAPLVPTASDPVASSIPSRCFSNPEWEGEVVVAKRSQPMIASRQRSLPTRQNPTSRAQIFGTLLSPRFRDDRRLQLAANNSPPMRIGERGEAVKRLQQALIDLGLPMPISTQRQGIPDGIYGNETAATVRRFQSKYGLKMDGVAGQQTLSKLDQLFLRPGPKPDKTNSIPERWLPILGGAKKVKPGNQVEFLIDGHRTFEAMVKAIKTATGKQHYIYLLGWWLSDDFPLIPGDPNSTIAKLFAAASQQGVQIRTMLWDQVGTQNTKEVKRINALSTGGAILDDNTLNHWVGSHHQKVLVVKGNQGLISFCGGVDINPDRIFTVGGGSSSGSSGGQGTPMHDVHCQIIGPAAHDLLGVFIQRWNAHPEHTKLDKAKGKLLGLNEPVPTAKGKHFVRTALTFNLVTSSHKCVKARSIRSVMIGAIRAARKFIYIEDQYLVSMEAANELQRALPNIQHLTIVIPHSSISDMPQVWTRRKAFIDRLQSSPHGHKVRVFYLVNPRSPKPFGPFTYIHAKTWVIDDELAIIGSANCNRRGWSHDSEVLTAIYNGASKESGLPFAQRLRMALWARHLNVSPSAVTDGVASARLWLTPPSGAWIRTYNQNLGRDPVKDMAISWDSVIDPSGDTVSPCPGGVETEIGIPLHAVGEFAP